MYILVRHFTDAVKLHAYRPVGGIAGKLRHESGASYRRRAPAFVAIVLYRGLRPQYLCWKAIAICAREHRHQCRVERC